MDRTIYFDNAATTFPKPEIVYTTMDETYRKYGVNAGRGSYRLAREANRIIDETRENLAGLVGLNNSSRVIFSSSATIAMNQIIFGLEWDFDKTVYVSPFEHNAIMRPLYHIINKYNIKLNILPFDSTTYDLDVNKMEQMFSINKPDYIFISHISNVTGYILPVAEITKLGKKHNAKVILDCAQSMGLLDINVNTFGADYFVFAGHKSLYGPFGCAGIIDNSNSKLNQCIFGGTGSDSLNLNMPESYPLRLEAASANIYAIAGLNAALTWIKNTGLENIRNKEYELTAKLIEGLRSVYGVNMSLPRDTNAHIGIISCTISDYISDEYGDLLDQEYNIAVRTGYHCAPLIHDLLQTKDKGGTVRFSLGYFNTDEEIDYLIQCMEEI